MDPMTPAVGGSSPIRPGDDGGNMFSPHALQNYTPPEPRRYRQMSYRTLAIRVTLLIALALIFMSPMAGGHMAIVV